MIASLPKVNPTELKKKLHHIIGERSPFSSRRHLSVVENYIEKEFKSYGLSVESDTFTYWGRSYRNIIGRSGPDRNAPLIILGAHLDSVEGSPGADDNASGVAVLLEAARILSGLRLQSQVLFCAFNLEEQNMVGSTYFAKKLKAAAVKVSAMISLEMVGFTDSRPGGQKYPVGLRWFYPDRGDFIGIVGNWRSNLLMRKFSSLMRRVPGLPVETLTVLGNGFLLPQVRLSDHSPFWDLGYPALLVTDTAFFRNPHYHGPSDTLETLNLDFMAKVCQGVIHGIWQLANRY
ncbi:MAG: M28 family peptidase [Candidatus Binatia bacterium]